MKSPSLFLFFILALLSSIGYAQEVSVYFQKDLNFGKFYISGNVGGNIRIPNNGGIIPSPDVNLLSSEYQPAILVISTDSEEYIDIQIEASADRLKAQEGGNLRLRLNKPDKTYYSIKKGVPAEISLGGCLEIEPGGASTAGDHFGRISVNVIILNE